jgi:septum site-determining protein MinC
VSSAARSPNAFRFLGRSFLALVFAPEPPIPAWLDELDLWLRRSTGFFAEKPVVLDLTRTSLSRVEYENLIADLRARNIRLVAVEGVDASWRGPELAPLGNGGRSTAIVDLPLGDTAPNQAPSGAASADQPSAPAADPEPAAPSAPASLLIDVPVRSGQSVFFPDGDVTVIGSVASGAEIVAGGSIHIYGTLRGRALAGSTGNSGARIFCNRLEAELLAIDGLYKTADDIPERLVGHMVQARLDRDALLMTPLD